MGFWRKIFGYSQREAWQIAAQQSGGRLVYGSAVEADKIEIKYKKQQIVGVITSKGPAVYYTILFATLKTRELIGDSPDLMKRLKKNKIQFIPEDTSKAVVYNYLLEYREAGVNTSPEDMLLKISLIKEAIDYAGRFGLMAPIKE